MAVPSRVFVGMVVFGLIASLAIVPYTILVLAGYEPETPSVLLPEAGEFTPGEKLVLVLGSLFSLSLTAVAWRGLLAGARRDATRKKEKAAETAEPAQSSGRDEQPPGYH